MPMPASSQPTRLSSRRWISRPATVAYTSVTSSVEPTTRNPWPSPYTDGSGRSPTACTDRMVSTTSMKVMTQTSQATGVDRFRELGGTARS